jgi:hypothetical protein
MWGVMAGTDPALHGILTIDGQTIVGVYTTPFFQTAVGYATPQRLFGTNRWFRVVLELCGQEDDAKKNPEKEWQPSECLPRTKR